MIRLIDLVKSSLRSADGLEQILEWPFMRFVNIVGIRRTPVRRDRCPKVVRVWLQAEECPRYAASYLRGY